MPKSPLNEAKNELKMEINKSFDLIQTINQLSQPLKIDQVHLIYELSFLKIFLAWELFLEKSFIYYMLGIKTESGYRPKPYATPRDEKHAYEIIKSGRSFPDWLNLEFIREKSEIFFENGEPFIDTLYNAQTIKNGLQMMKTTRNRIVHVSLKSKEEFKEMMRKEFGYAKDITPGEFLRSDVKKNKESYIDYFKRILFIAADKIVR